MSNDNKPGNLSGLLSHHFLLGRHDKTGLDWQVTIPFSTWLMENKADLDQAPLLATLGCLLRQNREALDNESSKLALNHFIDGIERLRQRQNLFTTSNSWILNSEVVLGISLGVFTAPANQSIKDWLVQVLESGLTHKDLPNLLRFSYLYCVLLSKQHTTTEEEITPETAVELAFEIWLARRFSDFLATKNRSGNWLEETQSSLLEQCLLKDIQIHDSWKAALIWYVISDYVNTRSQYPRLNLVISILSNFDAAMERWDKKWKIENEYDIQGILWLILRSVFDDLRYEESFPKLGRSGHRYDIAVPALELIIEVKYTRKSGDFKKIVDEVSKDAVQLTTQMMYKDIVVFVYDESCSVEQHTWAKNTIEKIDRIKACVIKSAPSMVRPSTRQSPRKKSK